MCAASSDHRPTRSDEHVGDMDTLFWRVERDPLLRNTMVAVFVLDKSPDKAMVMDRMERASRQVWGWRHRLVSAPFNLSNPRWIADPAFDLSYHVRWIGAPKERTLASVLDYARISAMSGLDRERPLWTVTVVDGLEGGGAAVIVKLHHVLIDGLGGIGLLPFVVDLSPTPGKPGPMPPEPEYRPMSTRDLVVDALATNTERLQQFAVAAGRQGMRAAPDVMRRPLSVLPKVERNVKALGRLLKPANKPLSPIMTGRLGWSRFAPLHADLESLKRAGRAHHASLNDAFLAVVAYGFARYHEELNAPVERLRTTIAISMRRPGDPAHGNHVLGGHFVMPVSTEHPTRNMRAYHALVEQLRDDTRQPLAGASAPIISGLGPFVSTFVGAAMKHCDLLMSNIPGIDAPIWMGGAAVTAMYGFGPIMGTATNATMVTYNGTAHIGLNIDASAVTELGLLVDCVQEGIDLMVAAAE